MASREIFIDTSGLYALVNRKDSHHAAARTVVERLIRTGRRFVASDYIVAESVNLANARGGAPVAVRVLDLIEQSTAIRLEWIAATRFDATKTFFRKHADHAYSFTDCTSFVLMRELKISQALTTDRHFSEAGFDVLLPTVD
jgi:predicted nucleic acid-binding protein